MRLNILLPITGKQDNTSCCFRSMLSGFRWLCCLPLSVLNVTLTKPSSFSLLHFESWPEERGGWPRLHINNSIKIVRLSYSNGVSIFEQHPLHCILKISTLYQTCTVFACFQTTYCMFLIIQSPALLLYKDNTLLPSSLNTFDTRSQVYSSKQQLSHQQRCLRQFLSIMHIQHRGVLAAGFRLTCII